MAGVASKIPVAREEGKWEAFLVDVTYEKLDEVKEGDGRAFPWPKDMPGRLEFTTEVSVIPNTFPYEDCEGEGCAGELV